MRKYSAIVAAVFGSAWAIMPEKLQAIVEFIELKVEGIPVTPVDAKVPTTYRNVGKVALLPLYGVISQKMNMMTNISGGTSTDEFGAMFDRAVGDPSIGAVVIDVDSPGGSVYGIHELASKIFNARGTKPIIAVANSLSASAAYWLASAADEVVVTHGGEVGSVGVIAAHTDYSEAEAKAGFKTTYVTAGKYKAEGNPHEPLADEARAAIQSRVDEYYDMMTADIARNRGVSVLKVKSGFGEGRVVGAKESVERNMADRIGTLENVLARLTASTPTPRRNKAALDLARISQ